MIVSTHVIAYRPTTVTICQPIGLQREITIIPILLLHVNVNIILLSGFFVKAVFASNACARKHITVEEKHCHFVTCTDMVTAAEKNAEIFIRMMQLYNFQTFEKM